MKEKLTHWLVTATLGDPRGPRETVAQLIGVFRSEWYALILTGVQAHYMGTRSILVSKIETDGHYKEVLQWRNPEVAADYWETRDGQWEFTDSHYIEFAKWHEHKRKTWGEGFDYQSALMDPITRAKLWAMGMPERTRDSSAAPAFVGPFVELPSGPGA